MTRGRRLLDLGKKLYGEIDRDHVSNGAAALAFYFVLALFPAAIFGLSLLPYLPIPNLQQAIMDLLRQALPASASDLFTTTVENVVSNRSGGLLSFGFLFTIWSASTGLYAVMQELNVVYDVEEGRPFWKARGIAILLTFLFFALVVATFALVVFGGMLQDWLGGALGWSSVLLTIFAILRWVLIGFALLLGFAIIYRLAPNTDLPFKLFSIGNVFATIGILLASLGFKLYVTNFGSYDATYGSLGAVIVLLMWLYIAGWVILLGGEVNDLLDREKGVEHREADTRAATTSDDAKARGAKRRKARRGGVEGLRDRHA